MRKTEGATTTLYIGAAVEVQIRGATRVTTTYYLFGSQRVAMRVTTGTITGTVTWLHADHLGSASLATTATGAKVAGSDARYTPFGEYWTGLAGAGNASDNRFTGQKRLTAGWGLDDFNARMYSAALARFISADTIVPQAGNPQALNRYTYVFNRPMVLIDPSGHDPWWKEPCAYGCNYFPTARDRWSRVAYPNITWRSTASVPQWRTIQSRAEIHGTERASGAGSAPVFDLAQLLLAQPAARPTQSPERLGPPNPGRVPSPRKPPTYNCIVNSYCDYGSLSFLVFAVAWTPDNIVASVAPGLGTSPGVYAEGTIQTPGVGGSEFVRGTSSSGGVGLGVGGGATRSHNVGWATEFQMVAGASVTPLSIAVLQVDRTKPIGISAFELFPGTSYPSTFVALFRDLGIPVPVEWVTP